MYFDDDGIAWRPSNVVVANVEEICLALLSLFFL